MKFTTKRSLLACVMWVGCGGNSVMSMTDSSVATDSATPTPDSSITDGGVRALSANDISILFPFGRGDLWPASVAKLTPALFGEFNPNRFPGFAMSGVFSGPGDTAAEYASMRLVALRIEPCFTACTDERSAELRFVLQALEGNRFADGAVHVSHHLSAAQFALLRAAVAELQLVSPENSEPVLRVSPALAAQGMSGAYASLLRQKLELIATDATLRRVTFMSRTNLRSPTWEFAGIDVSPSSSITTTTIADFPGAAAMHLGAPINGNYSFNTGNPGSPTAYPDSAFAPAFRFRDFAARTPAEQQEIYSAIARRHNPNMLTPDTTDCVGCHISSPVRSQVVWRDFSSTNAYSAEAAASRMSGNADANPDNLRMFGYFDATPVVSQRVANDTHLSLAVWNR